MLWTYNQHNFAGGRLDKELMGRQDLTQYHKGASELRNFLIRRQGNLSKRRGTNLACDLSGLSIGSYRLIPLVFSRNEGFYILLSGGYAYLCNKNGILTVNGAFTREATTLNAYRIESGISDSRVDDIDFVQSGDTIFIVHHELPPMKIVFYRYGATLADGTVIPPYSLRREQINFGEEVHAPPEVTSVTPTWSSGTQKKTVNYVATYVGEDGAESFQSAKKSVQYGLPWPDGEKITINVKAAGVEKPKEYRIYKDDGTGFGFIGRISAISGSTNAGSFTDDYITPDMSTTPPDRTSRKLFNSAGDFPSVVSLYQQRLVLGASDKDPFTFWMSCTGDIYNFSTHASLREDDAITATLAATEQPEINHAVLSKELMLFANSGEWEISPVSGNTLSFKTVSAKMQSAIGSARWTKPIIVGDEIIFVDSTGERVLATRYNYASDGYESLDLTVLSQWMFRTNPIRRMAYRTSPDSTIHCAMDDGSLNVMVYMKEHEVCAWSRHELGGRYKVRDVACSKASYRGSTDIMYLVQNSTSGSYELWSEREDMPYRTGGKVLDFVCMDRCRMIPAGTVVDGGMTAVGIVSGRVFTEGDAVTESSVCGYVFESRFESVYPDAKGGGETLQMTIMNATEAHIRAIDSSSFSVGALGANVAFDRSISIGVSGSGGDVTLGDCDARPVFTGINTRDPRIRIRHSEPWPLNILSIGVTYQVEAENHNGRSNERDG